MVFGKKPKPNEERVMPMPVPIKIKDPENLRLLTSENAEEFLSQARTFKSACLDLIYDYWRFSKLYSKVSNDEVGEDLKESLCRFSDNLKKHGFLIKDLTGESYNAGMVVDVIHVDKSHDGKVSTAIISETIRPAVYLNDHLIQKGEVIVTKPAED